MGGIGQVLPPNKTATNHNNLKTYAPLPPPHVLIENKTNEDSSSNHVRQVRVYIYLIIVIFRLIYFRVHSSYKSSVFIVTLTTI